MLLHADQCRGGPGLERYPADGHLIGDDGEGIEIGERGYRALPPRLFGCQIFRGSGGYAAARGPVLTDCPDETEVRDMDPAVVRNEDVFRLDIPMDVTRSVREKEGATDLLGDAGDRFRREG